MILQRLLDLSRDPEFDIRYIAFVHRILKSPDKGREILNDDFVDVLDKHLLTLLNTRYNDEYQKSLCQFIEDHSLRIQKLEDSREEMRTLYSGLSFISPAKMKQRIITLKEIKAEKATLQNELNNPEHIVIDMLWESLENQCSDSLV